MARTAFSWLGFVLTLLAGAVLAAIALNLALLGGKRLNFASPLPFGIRDDSDRLSYVRLKPNFDGLARTGIRYSTNELGFRGGPVDWQASHVVFLGDSTTFGLGLPNEDTYAEQVGRLARERNWPIRPLNAASPGQGTLDELAILEELLNNRRLSVAAVVMGFFQNDISNNFEVWSAREALARSRGPENWKQRLDASLRGFPAWTHLVGSWFALKERLATGQPVQLRSLALAQAANFATATHGEGGGASGPSRQRLDFRLEYADRPGREVEWNLLAPFELQANRAFKLTLDAVALFADRCQRARVPCVLLYLPDDDSEIFEGTSPLFKSVLLKAARDGGLLVLDAVEFYRKLLAERGIDPKNASRLDIVAGHPNAATSRLLAEALLPFLLPDR